MNTEILTQIREFHIGGITFHSYGFILGLALLILFYPFFSKLPVKFIKSWEFWTLILIMLVGAIAGARLYYVFLNWRTYKYLQITYLINISQGGTSILGIFLISIPLYFLLYTILLEQKFEKYTLFYLPDKLLENLPLTQAFGRLANFINLELLGPPTTFLLKTFVPVNERPAQYKDFTHFHPVFFYEAILNLLSYFFIKILINKKKKFTGYITAVYFINYGIIRIVTERLRIDSYPILFDFIKIPDIVSLGLIFFGMTTLLVHGENKKQYQNNSNS